MLRHAVTNDVDVAIADTRLFNEDRTQHEKNKAGLRAGNIISLMMGRKLWAFFNHWREVNAKYQFTVKTKI